MERARYPQKIIDITSDIYTDSTFQVQTRGSLTRKIIRERGIIQGCPWSAIAFVQALDPWLRWLERSQPLSSLPAPCQAYMDDICMSSTQEAEIHDMLRKTGEYLQYAGMEVKHAKCALIHAQRSGNNWTKKDNTRAVCMEIQGGEIPKLGKTGHYKYLGHQVGLDNSTANQQLQEIINHFTDTVQKIDTCPLPVNKKIEAINIMAISQLNFYFPNMQISEKALKTMEDKIVDCIRGNLKLNTSSTRAHIFTPRREGGLGVIKPSTMYHAKRISFLLSVLNSDDIPVRSAARSSLTLHMTKRKVPISTDPEEENFCGYKTKENGQLYKESKVNWSKSTFVELNELCNRLKVRMYYDDNSDLYSVSIPATPEGDIYFRYTDAKHLFTALKKQDLEKTLDSWRELKQQGRLLREAFPKADMTNSNEHLKNTAIWENLTRFITKGRLQLLETNAVNKTYYPGSYPRECTLCGYITDTNSHALNNCRRLKGLYTQRHDRCVELVRQALTTSVMTEFCELFQNQRVSMDGRYLDTSKPDLCLIDHSNSVAFVIELSNPFDAFIEKCYQSKFTKYLPLYLKLREAGFSTKIIVLVVGSLGTVHHRVVPGLRLLGMSRRSSASLAKYLSVSVMIGSRRVWARIGHLMERDDRRSDTQS